MSLSLTANSIEKEVNFKISRYYYIISIVLTSRILDFVRLPAFFYYIAIIILFMYNFPLREKLKVQNIFVILFAGVAFVSIVLNEIDPFFKPYERYLSFFLNLLVFGPIIISFRLIKVRIVLLEAFCQIFTIITILSFLGLVVGIIPLDGIGGFQGVTVHAMTLSALSGVALVYSIFQYYRFNKSSLYKWAILLIIVICFFVIIISASRAALVGTIVSSFILLYKLNSGKLTKMLKLVIISITILFTSYPLWSTYTEKLVHKFDASIEKDNVFSSREKLWDARIKEFNTSPIYGIGFGNMLREYNEYGIDDETGGIESGSSWGMILSMTGLLGACIFLLLNINYAINLIKLNTSLSPLLLALLSFFTIHMISEGYVFASGNILMISFWLTLSVSDYTSLKYYQHK